MALAACRPRGPRAVPPRRAVAREPPAPPVPTRLELLRFAAPLAAVSVTGPVLSTIDAAFVGRCAGTVELAALGPACTVTDLIYLQGVLEIILICHRTPYACFYGSFYSIVRRRT